MDWWLWSIDVVVDFWHSFLHRKWNYYKMSLHFYLKWQLSYVLRVTHYQDAMALVKVELQPSIRIFRLKLKIMGIYLIYLLWVPLPFSSYMLVYYWFVYSHPYYFFSSFRYSVVDSSLGRNLFLWESYWYVAHSHAGYYNLCFYSMLCSWFCLKILCPNLI